jgi:hypothetical protein
VRSNQILRTLTSTSEASGAAILPENREICRSLTEVFGPLWLVRVPGMSQAEVRCLMGGFIVMCLTINFATHRGDRMDTLRLFMPVWATFAWSWGGPDVFARPVQSKLTQPCRTSPWRVL